jgi:hypothetical protein
MGDSVQANLSVRFSLIAALATGHIRNETAGGQLPIQSRIACTTVSVTPLEHALGLNASAPELTTPGYFPA